MIMTSRQRVLATIAHQEPDRVPYSLRLVPELLDMVQSKIGTRDYPEYFGHDIRYIPEPVPALPPKPDGVPVEEWTPPPTEEDIAELKKKTQALHDRGLAVCGGYYMGIYERAKEWIGDEATMVGPYADPKGFADMLDRIVEWKCLLYGAFVEAGVDIVWIGDDLGTQRSLIMSPKQYREWYRPRHQRLVDHLRSIRGDVKIAFHSCGYVTPLLRDLIEIGIDILEALVAGQPDMVECWNNLGSAYLNTGRGAEAIAAFEKALELDPGLVMAANNIGTAHLKSGRPGEALAVYRRNTEKFPDHCGAWSGLGNVLVTMEKFDDAIAAFNHSLELKSDHIDAFHGRAVANHRRAVAFGGSDYSIRALDDYHKVADLNPRHFHAHQNMGAMLQILGRHDDAVEAFRRAIEINPKFVAAYSSLAHSLQQSCRWQNLEAIIERVIEYTREEMSSGSEISTSPFNLLQLSAPGDVRLAAAKQIASLYSTTVWRVSGAATFDYRANTRGKLRIGYLSPDFRSHSVGRAFQALLPAHDRERFEVFGYYTVQGGDEVTERLRRNFDGFVELAGRPFLEAAQQINDDGIDILVDLAGHTRGSRFEILALKPAPVQAHFLGYGFTTGADYVDYLITDETTIPEAEQAFCTEHVVYLPHHSLPASKPVIAEASYARAEFGLPEQGFVFADFNGHYKIDADIFTAWMRILRKAPDSVLWLMGFGASDDNLRREAEARGVAPERLIFAERRPHDEHLARLSLADLALDTYHHAGGVTSTDALWAGLPVLTLLTDGMVDRTGASLMQAAGLPELIATSVDDYMQRALGYYHDRAALADLKARLRARQSTAPLFDMPRFSRYLEAAYQAMWQAHLDGQNKNIRIPA